MNFDRQTSRRVDNPPEFADAPIRKPLELLRDLETPLRRQTVEAIAPIVSEKLAIRLEDASDLAEASFEKLVEFDFEQISQISDSELKPARMRVGLSFAGFGGLAIAFLMLFITTLRPQLSTAEGIRAYWYPYAFLVSLGVTGMMIVSREVMRSHLARLRESILENQE